MDKEILISSFQSELKNSRWDIRAETQVLSALRKGLSIDDFLVLCYQVFKREYSKDVVSVNIKEDANKQELLELYLSRTGLFDQLPEGIFFQSETKEFGKQNATDMSLDHQRNRKKEEQIRRFFLPFDNDFFLHRLQLEQEETILLEGLSSGILNDYFIKFWNLPEAMPKMFLIPMVLLLPHAHKITGDLALTAQALSYVLKEPVGIRHVYTQSTPAEIAFPPQLGDGELGINFVCGQDFLEDNPVLAIEIGPITNSAVKDYLENGKRELVMDTFYRFFIPAGLDIVTTIKLAVEKQDMLLEKGSEPILGFSTVLG